MDACPVLENPGKSTASSHSNPGMPLIDGHRPGVEDQLEGAYRDATFTLLLSGTATHSRTATKCRPPCPCRLRRGHGAVYVATIRTFRLGPFRKLWVKTYGPQAEYWKERPMELRWG